jgi:uncharacterized membrane-anchored protein
MKPARIDRVLEAAIAEGVLPVSAVQSEEEPRPWPVVLLIGLGAWLAAIPLLIAVGLLFGDFFIKGPGALIVGVSLVALAVVMFRSKKLPIFVEQLALPALLVGGGSLGFGLFHALPPQAACATLGAIALGIAIAVERHWVREVLGAIAAVLVTLACVSDRALNLDRGSISQFWLAWHISFALWLAAQWVQASVAQSSGGISLAAAIESIGAGWLLAVLAGLAWWSGMTFLVGATLDRNIVTDIARELSERQRIGAGPRFVQPAVSVALAAASAWIGATAWASLRQTWCVGLAAIALVLCWFMPVLGAILLALMVCLTRQRWMLAGAAGVACAWVIGAFYYGLEVPLTRKALILLVAGAVLAGISWFAIRSEDDDRDESRDAASAPVLPPAPRPLTFAGIAATLLLSLGIANYAIWDKEHVIRNGQPVFVELAPIDPRSLMQGDYMAINFRVPDDSELSERTLTWGRPHVVAQIDERGVAKLVRIHKPEAALAPGETRIELTPKNGRWTLVTDAWFFREGDGQRWSAARYGEFRVAPDGRALLVGMADGKLQPISGARPH